jgi:hypothetical protein
VGAASFPTYEEAAEAVVPGVRALDDPATWLAAYGTDQRRLTASTKVRTNSAQPERGQNVGIVVPLVETAVLGSTWAA